MEHEIDQKKGSTFFAAVPSLLAEVDVFGESSILVRAGARDLTISTVDLERKTVRNAFYMRVGKCFELLDVEHIYDALEENVIKSGIVCQVNKAG